MEVNKIYIFQNKNKRSVMKLAILDITNTTIKSLNLDTNTLVRMKLEDFNAAWEVLEPIGDYDPEANKVKPLVLIRLPHTASEAVCENIAKKFNLEDYHVFTMPTYAKEGSVKVFFEKDYQTLPMTELKKMIEAELLKLKFNNVKE